MLDMSASRAGGGTSIIALLIVFQSASVSAFGLRPARDRVLGRHDFRFAPLRKGSELVLVLNLWAASRSEASFT